MTDPLSAWHIQDVTGATAPTYDEQLTPTYSDLCHYADVGRRLTQAAGLDLDTHPTADVVLQALRTPKPNPQDIIDAAIALSAAAKVAKRKP